MEIWGPGHPEILRSGDLEIQKCGVQKIKKIKILKIQIRSAQNVGKVWISRKKSSWPYLGPSEAIFSMDRKNRKSVYISPIFLGGPMGLVHPVWALAAIHPRWGNRYVLTFINLDGIKYAAMEAWL